METPYQVCEYQCYDFLRLQIIRQVKKEGPPSSNNTSSQIYEHHKQHKRFKIVSITFSLASRGELVAFELLWLLKPTTQTYTTYARLKTLQHLQKCMCCQIAFLNDMLNLHKFRSLVLRFGALGESFFVLIDHMVFWLRFALRHTICFALVFDVACGTQRAFCVSFHHLMVYHLPTFVEAQISLFFIPKLHNVTWQAREHPKYRPLLSVRDISHSTPSMLPFVVHDYTHCCMISTRSYRVCSQFLGG